MVNKAVEDLVTSNFGAEKWLEIKERAQVKEDIFLSNESYPDSLTYDLVGAASAVLGLAVRDVLIAFGEHWVLHTARNGYGHILEANGRTLPEFLINLPSLHARIAMIYPDLQPPRFSCSDITDKSLMLHYISDRPGLTDFVIGILQGLGKMFNTPVVVQISERKTDGADHDVFQVCWESTAHDESPA